MKLTRIILILLMTLGASSHVILFGMFDDEGPKKRSSQARSVKAGKTDEEKKEDKREKDIRDRKKQRNNALDQKRNRRGSNDLFTQLDEGINYRGTLDAAVSQELIDRLSHTVGTPEQHIEVMNQFISYVGDKMAKLNLDGRSNLGKLREAVKNMRDEFQHDAQQKQSKINPQEEAIVVADRSVFEHLPRAASSFFKFLGTKAYSFGTGAVNLSAFVIKQGAIGYVTQSVIQASGGGMAITFLVNLGIAGAPEAYHLYELSQQGKLTQPELTAALKRTVTNTVVRMALAAALDYAMSKVTPYLESYFPHPDQPVCLPEDNPGLIAGDHNAVTVFNPHHVPQPQSGLHQLMLPAPTPMLMLPAPVQKAASTACAAVANTIHHGGNAPAVQNQLAQCTEQFCKAVTTNIPDQAAKVSAAATYFQQMGNQLLETCSKDEAVQLMQESITQNKSQGGYWLLEGLKAVRDNVYEASGHINKAAGFTGGFLDKPFRSFFSK